MQPYTFGILFYLFFQLLEKLFKTPSSPTGA
jgi:hypothetical protein